MRAIKTDGGLGIYVTALASYFLPGVWSLKRRGCTLTWKNRCTKNFVSFVGVGLRLKPGGWGREPSKYYSPPIRHLGSSSLRAGLLALRSATKLALDDPQILLNILLRINKQQYKSFTRRFEAFSLLVMEMVLKRNDLDIIKLPMLTKPRCLFLFVKELRMTQLILPLFGLGVQNQVLISGSVQHSSQFSQTEYQG